MWRRNRVVLVVYAVLGLSFWPLPLLNRLHAESVAVVAVVAFFVAGRAALAAFQKGAAFEVQLAVQLAALGVPWALLTATLLWAPNCDYLRGLLLYGLFPGVSVVLAVGLAWAIHALPLRWKGAVHVGVGVFMLLGGVVWDLGFHPQFYVYNHIFGGYLGPIYDEELTLRPGLFVFRALTLLWATGFWLVGQSRQVASQDKPGVYRCLGVVTLLMGLVYGFSVPLGINTSYARLQQVLGSVYRTAHFDLYYDAAVLRPEAVRFLAEDHEYRYVRLSEQLAVEGPPRIESYLYPDPETRARLTGARYTNVAPVWLARPQVHVLVEAYDAVFAHELVHVFSRAFGLPVLRASWSVGLVEGLAVALEPPDGRPTPHEQVVSAALAEAPADSLALASDLAARLSPLGFWTGRGAVSYTTMGSFVRYLLDAYGPEALKQVYARGDFAAVYGKSVAVLAGEWQAYLLRQPVVARAAVDLATRRFAVPSLFERDCPHHVPPWQRAWRQAEEALVGADTLRALRLLERSLEALPVYPPALDTWARLGLAQGKPAAVLARLDTLRPDFRTPVLDLRLGDAWAMQGQASPAEARYAAVLQALPLYAGEEQAVLWLRTSLARSPAVVRILASGDSAAVQARRLAALSDPPEAARWMLALRLAADGQYESAAHRLRSTAVPAVLEPAPASVLRRQRLVWLAEFTYRAGSLPAARSYAEQAATAFRAVGDLNAVHRMEDLRDRIDRQDRTHQDMAGQAPEPDR
jgi:hypothetical protein